MGNVITGTDLEIDVGKNYKGKINIFGKTEQKTRSGKNKFNYKKASDINNTIVSTYRLFEISGLEPNTQYTFSGYDITSTTTAYIYLWSGNTQATSAPRYFISSPDNYNTATSTTFTSNAEGKIYLAMYDTTEAIWNEFIQKFKNAQIEKGTVATDYEEYGVMPSPDYPSDIENVEGKNKLNISTIVKGRLDSGVIGYETNVTELILNKNSFTFAVNSTYKGVSSDFIPVIPTKTYVYSQNESLTESFYIGAVCYDKNKNWLKNLNIASITIPSDCYYIKIQWTSTTIGTKTVTNPQLEINAKTPYVPYNSLEFKVEGKNKLKGLSTPLTDSDYWHSVNSNYFELLEDGWGKFSYDNKSGTSTVFINAQVKLNSINLKPNTQYTFITEFRNSTISENANAFFTVTSGTATDVWQSAKTVGYAYINQGKTVKATATTKEDFTGVITGLATYLRLGAGSSGTVEARISVIEGDYDITDYEYEPYKSQVVYFPLGEGQKLMEGSYLADDGIHHKRGQVVLDELTWTKINIQDDICLYTTKNIPNIKYAKTNTELGNGIAEKYKIRIGSGMSGNDAINHIAIDVNQVSVNTREIQPTGVFEYELAEPAIVPYTEEQQEAWNDLQNIYLYKGKNYVYSISLLTPEIELTYIKLLEELGIYISENGHLIIPEYGIDYLIDLNASNIPSMPEAVEASVRIVGRDGDITLNTTYEPMNFTIVCYTDDNLTPQEKVLEEQKINRFMDSIKNKTKSFGIEKDDKFYEVKYNGALTTIRFPAHIQFTIPLKSSESYAMDLIKKKIKGNNSENSNTIKDVGAVFTILGPAQTPKISFNNYEMFYDNVLLENTKLVIDSNKSTVTHINGVTGAKTNAMRYYNHQFPKVKYGENVLAVNSGIGDASQVKVEWNDLKL